MIDTRLPFYAAVAGTENCANRLLNDTREMIRQQGDSEALLDLVNKQLLLINVASAALLAYRTMLLEEEI